MLQKPLSLLFSDFSLTPVVATEIEFYLLGSQGADALAAWQADVQARCEAQGIALHRIEKERGDEQHEISLMPTDAQNALAQLLGLKEIVSATASAHGFVAEFAAKPKADQPGSGLHIHVHLADEAGTNIYFKNDSQISEGLHFSIGGLVEWLIPCMCVFAPSEASYARFVKGSNAPTTASWGANNRTVAIRLPDKPHSHKHIEHRMAGADAAPEAVIAVILAAIHDGLSRRIVPASPQIYGDASLEMYQLPKVPLTLADAQLAWQQAIQPKRYFSETGL